MMTSRLCAVSLAASLTLMLWGCGEQPPASPPAVSPTAPPAAHDDHDGHDHAKQAHDDAKTVVADQADHAGDAADTWVAKAQPLIAQATQYVEDHKYELAQQTLVKLDQLKPHLPVAMQDQITNLHKLVDAAKSSGIKLPGM